MLNIKKINFELLNKFLFPVFSLYFIFIVSSTLPNFYPMFIDSGTYAYVASQINKGKSLYRDVFEIKLPGIYYIYAFIFKIFPDTRWSLYIVDILVTISIFLLIFRILKNFNLEKFFWAFSIFFLTSYRVFPSYCDGNLNEHWYLFFYLVFFYCITSEESKFKKLLAGFSMAINFFFKQNLLLLTLILIIIFWKKIKNVYFFFGFIPIFIFFSFIILKNIPESIRAILIFPLQRSGGEKIPLFVKLKNSFIYGPLFQFFTLSIFAIVKKGEWGYLEKHLLYEIIILLIIVFTLPLFYFHYLIILLVIFVRCFIIIAKKYPEYIILFLLFILTISPAKFIKIRFKHSIKALKLTFIEKDLRIAAPPMTFTIIHHIKENEKFIMIPSYPEIYFLTKTESPYRFFIIDDIVARFFKNEFREIIRKNPPSYVYLEKNISYFENIFNLNKNEYIIEKVDENFYKFKLIK